jgi:uracil-DNA glycosylase family 4
MADDAAAIAQQLRKHLAWQESEGSKSILVSTAEVARKAEEAPKAARPAPGAPSQPRQGQGARLPEASGRRPSGQAPTAAEDPALAAAQTLDEVRTVLGDCRRCKLCNGRTQIVFGVGNPKAELVFVGEGPGADEDAQGVPFVGKAGQLLTKMIEAMKFRRDDVYICNVVKCRPPNNRNPEPDEIAACQPFLLRQIELIHPAVIVALGTFAAQTLLASRVPISRLRGQWFEYQGIKLMPTLHPAYLLRNPNDKRLVWEDIKLVMRELESHA